MELRWKDNRTKTIGLAYVTDEDVKILEFLGYEPDLTINSVTDDEIDFAEVEFWAPKSKPNSLTELEKQKVIACIHYIEGKFMSKRYKLEVAYNELGHYDDEYHRTLGHTMDLEQFYSNLAEKLKEVL